MLIKFFVILARSLIFGLSCLGRIFNRWFWLHFQAKCSILSPTKSRILLVLADFNHFYDGKANKISSMSADFLYSLFVQFHAPPWYFHTPYPFNFAASRAIFSIPSSSFIAIFLFYFVSCTDYSGFSILS